MKPLLVGEAPGKNEVTEQPLMGRVGKRMAALAGLTYDEYLERFDRVNLLHVRQDTKEKGFEFDHAAASIAAHKLFLDGTIVPGRVVVMLGWRVTRAFFSPYYKAYFERYDCGDVAFYAMPHPSGVNRWWNEDENVRKASLFLRGILLHDLSERVKAERA